MAHALPKNDIAPWPCLLASDCSHFVTAQTLACGGRRMMLVSLRFFPTSQAARALSLLRTITPPNRRA